MKGKSQKTTASGGNLWKTAQNAKTRVPARTEFAIHPISQFDSRRTNANLIPQTTQACTS
jgi:hypothetical protein